MPVPWLAAAYNSRMGEYLSKKIGALQALLLGIPPTEWLIAPKRAMMAAWFVVIE